MLTDPTKPAIGIVGGTGALGSGLARCWAAAGYRVVIGSRSREKAARLAEALGPGAAGEDNIGAVLAAEIVVVTVPFASQEATLRAIAPAIGGRIVVDTTVPLVPPKVSTVQLPPAGSAALIASRLLGREARVVSAFHTLSAGKLRPGHRADCDILVFGDDRDACSAVMPLATIVARRALHGGPLANSAAAEALTSVLIWLNRTYKVPGAGLAITGLDPDTSGLG
jgi:NADPH-dependent F420 reductase